MKIQIYYSVEMDCLCVVDKKIYKFIGKMTSEFYKKIYLIMDKWYEAKVHPKEIPEAFEFIGEL